MFLFAETSAAAGATQHMYPEGQTETPGVQSSHAFFEEGVDEPPPPVDGPGPGLAPAYGFGPGGFAQYPGARHVVLPLPALASAGAWQQVNPEDIQVSEGAAHWAQSGT